MISRELWRRWRRLTNGHLSLAHRLLTTWLWVVKFRYWFSIPTQDIRELILTLGLVICWPCREAFWHRLGALSRHWISWWPLPDKRDLSNPWNKDLVNVLRHKSQRGRIVGIRIYRYIIRDKLLWLTDACISCRASFKFWEYFSFLTRTCFYAS